MLDFTFLSFEFCFCMGKELEVDFSDSCIWSDLEGSTWLWDMRFDLDLERNAVDDAVDDSDDVDDPDEESDELELVDSSDDDSSDDDSSDDDSSDDDSSDDEWDAYDDDELEA